MPFSRYMELCLYHPVGGYYSRSGNQFGKAGDFYTSSDVHAVFGRLLARQFEEMWRALDRPPCLEILDLGPGRGLFGRDVLDWSKKKFTDFFAALTYTFQESSPALREKLAENLHEHFAAGKAALSHRQFQSPVETRLAASAPTLAGTHAEEGGQSPCIHRSTAHETPLIVFANEFFDALPVETLSTQGKLHLGFQNGRLTEIWLPPTEEELEFLDRFCVCPKGSERIEVSLRAQLWMAEIASAIQHGFFLVVDYGYTRAQQLAGRFRGTLMAYREHSSSSNPYQAPGEQDLTAHVNFTALCEAAERAGMRLEKLLTQSQFLMGIGESNQFADAFEDCQLPQERAKVALQLKHLVTPAGMGEDFHVQLASRGVELARISSLSGLRYST
jgi:SAM-dependent MidA family methyltransferase